LAEGLGQIVVDVWNSGKAEESKERAAKSDELPDLTPEQLSDFQEEFKIGIYLVCLCEQGG